MWHIILMAYWFVVVLFSVVQPSVERALIYLVLLAVLPTVFVAWVRVTRRRNRLAKMAEQQTQIVDEEI